MKRTILSLLCCLYAILGSLAFEPFRFAVVTDLHIKAGTKDNVFGPGTRKRPICTILPPECGLWLPTVVCSSVIPTVLRQPST